LKNDIFTEILGFERFQEKSWKKYRTVTIIFYIILAAIMAMLLYGQFFIKNDVFKTNPCHYIDKIDMVGADGSINSISLPSRVKIDKNEDLILRGRIPDDVIDGMVMCYEGGKSFIFSIDGEVRYEFDSENTMLPGRTVKSVLFSIPLSKEDAGKSFEILKYNIRSNYNNATVLLYGYPDSIKGYVISEYRLSIILCLFLAAISVVLIFGGWYIGFRNEGRLSVRILGIGVFLVSIWLLCESMGFQFLFNSVYIDGIIEYMISTVVPIPFLIYLNILQKRRYEKAYNISAWICVIDYFVTAFLHHTYILDYEQTRAFINFVIIAIFVEIIVTMIMDFYKGYLKDYIAIYWGLLGFIVFVIMEVVALGVSDGSSHGEFVLVGLYVLLMAAVIHSSNEIKDYENERQRAIDSSMLKTNFLTNMSHEIRTPINTIIGMNEMIIRETNDDKIYAYSEKIKNSSDLLLGIISDILNLSKIEAGKLELLHNKYKSAIVIDSIKQVLIERTGSKNLTYDIEIDENIPREMEGDDIRIRQIANNLISNATKYTPEGNVTINISGYEISEKEFEIVFKITDTGIGIKNEDLTHLFDTFSRFDEIKNKHIQGTGLGLAITKNLIDLMQGSICIDSVYGSGSSFTVRIPQKIVDKTPIGKDWEIEGKDLVKSAYSAKFTAPEARILAVDDNESNLMVITQFLKKTKVRVETVTKGIEAIKMCNRKKYDLILLDHMMPEMDGIEVMSHIKEDDNGANKDTPVIILTANAISGCKEEYLSLGFTDYLSKPINPVKFEEMVENYLPKELINVCELNKGSDSTKDSSEEIDASIKEEGVKMSDLIDRKKMITLYGDEGFVDEIIRKVAEDTLLALGRLKDSLAKEDYSLYAIDAHGIKGMMASIYCESMRLRSKDHEFAAKELRIDYIKEDFEKYCEEIESLCNELLKD